MCVADLAEELRIHVSLAELPSLQY